MGKEQQIQSLLNELTTLKRMYSQESEESIQKNKELTKQIVGLEGIQFKLEAKNSNLEQLLSVIKTQKQGIE